MGQFFENFYVLKFDFWEIFMKISGRVFYKKNGIFGANFIGILLEFLWQIFRPVF